MSTSREQLEALAARHGFSAVGFARVGPTPHADAFDRWLAAGMHADMDYLPRGAETRRDPRTRMASARTAMALAVHHHHVRPPDPGGLTGMVARYAWGRDYHNLVGKALRKLLRDLRAEGVESWGGVDTAPILERSWGAEAGLGFVGKNGVLIQPARTSWMVLAVVFVDLDIAPDPPLRDHCGRCVRCLTACPTQAFPEPRVLDARRCIAYWTIEAQGLPPRALRPASGRWVFGCDVCQEVCPHNVTPPCDAHADLAPRHAWLDLAELVAADDASLDERFLGTPLRRPRPAGLKRNALLVLGNLDRPGAVEAIRPGLAHPAPVVRAAAVWALARHGALPAELVDDDPMVGAELAAAHAGAVSLVGQGDTAL